MKMESSTPLLQSLTKRERFVLVLSLVLLIPALLINLGLLTVLDDEAIRGLVALEMWYSGEYIAPTINGIPYLNKPPLYNWIILISYELFGEASEFSLRFPTVIFTLLYGGLVYHLYRKEMGSPASIVIALLTITCGRMFFFDTFLGLIDICFSMCMFSLMIGSYFLAKQEQWSALFLFSYGLGAIGFLLKTYPAIVFLGISLLVILIAQKEFKKLFTIQHVLGILLFSFLVFGYYFWYSLDNDIYALLIRMVTESSDRTVVKFGVLKTILHLFTFPFEVFYHFIPWTILIVYLFKRGAFARLWEHPFLRMNLFLLSANIILYWTSPQVYARYLLMFPPLMFAPLYYLHLQHKNENTLHYKIVKCLLYLIVAIVVVGCLSTLFIDRVDAIPNRYLKAGILCSLCAIGAYFTSTAKRFHFIYIFFFVIVFRIGFDWFVFPDRNANDYGNELRMSAIQTAKKYKTDGLYVDKDLGINRSVSYYITKENQRILQAVDIAPSGMFIAKEASEDCTSIGTLKSRTPGADYMISNCQN